MPRASSSLWFLKVHPERAIHHTWFARTIEVAIATLMITYIGFNVWTYWHDPPKQTVSVDADELLARGGLLYQHGCRCTNTSFRFGEFVTYALDDADYEYCESDEWLRLTGPIGSIMCVTATYDVWKKFNGRLETLGSDIVLSIAKLTSDIESFVSKSIFAAWNYESDVLRVANLITPSEGFASNYTEALQVEDYLERLGRHTMSLISISNERYLQTCNPIGCVEQQQVSYVGWLLGLVGNVGGMFSVLASLGASIILLRDDAYLKHLFKEWIHKRLSPEKIAYLGANDPTADFEMRRQAAVTSIRAENRFAESPSKKRPPPLELSVDPEPPLSLGSPIEIHVHRF